MGSETRIFGCILPHVSVAEKEVSGKGHGEGGKSQKYLKEGLFRIDNSLSRGYSINSVLIRGIWMRYSRQADYAVKVMLELAASRQATIREVARRQQISAPYVGRIAQLLA